jgi:Uma2 family endonuclease
MATILDTPSLVSAGPPAEPLEQGQHLDRESFHAGYRAMPPEARAELIQGVVYMPSPLYSPHARLEGWIAAWLGAYAFATPGVVLLPGVSTCLGEDGEVQPDQSLSILPECGGQVREDALGRLVTPPELVVEVAASSASYDLFEKLEMYERSAVVEYLVVLEREGAVRWLAREAGAFADLGPEGGVYRSRVFPGLWLDAPALFAGDTPALKAALEAGLASAEYAEFAARLGPTGG